MGPARRSVLPFWMETPTSVRESVRRGDWATSIDLLNACFHIPIHPRDRKWLRCVWKNRDFQFRALPFGLAPVPRLFTKVVRELCIFLRQKGVRLKVCLDDWLILASSADLCHRHTQSVLELCTRLGFHLNTIKSELSPAQQFTFLGILFDTVHWLVLPADHRVQRLSLCISPSFYTSPQCPRQSLGYAAGFYGITSSTDSSGMSSQARSSKGLSGEVVAVSPLLGCPRSPRSLDFFRR